MFPCAIGAKGIIMNATSSVEMQMLFCATALGIVQLVLAVLASVFQRGMPWALGPRDGDWPALGLYGARLDRAFRNFLETFPFFAAAVLLIYALQKTNATSALGAQVYVWARLLYVPVYLLGIPFLRTLVWTAGMAGIVMVMSAYWPGM
jgi:uncharacterized MAPEG superfamily protein